MRTKDKLFNICKRYFVEGDKLVYYSYDDNKEYLIKQENEKVTIEVI
jgi:hypothetical protein